MPVYKIILSKQAQKTLDKFLDIIADSRPTKYVID